MSVNPNLQTLMGLIDELQDQMPEGKYLEAMNALRDLHAIPETRPPPPRPAPQRVAVPEGHVEMTQEENTRYERQHDRQYRRDQDLPEVLRALNSVLLWKIVCREWNKEGYPRLEDHEMLPSYPYMNRTRSHNPSTEQWWLWRTVEQKIALIREALLDGYERWKQTYNEEKNPEPEVCPFISRHSVGKWEDPINPRARWNCVCGSVNLLAKNWRQHEISDKHKKWNDEGRNISVTIKKKMLDVACHLRSRQTKAVLTYWTPSHVWVKNKANKDWNPGVKICQGVIHGNGVSICGYQMTWSHQHDTYRPQSLNEWICSELKGKPWEYKVVNPRWITGVTEPVLEEKSKVNLEPIPVPPTLPELPHRSGGLHCPVRRRVVYWMDEERYARFISILE